MTRNTVLWFLVAINAIAVVANRIFPSTPVIILLLTFTPVVFAWMHGAMRYRWQGILVFMAATLVISNILENLSIMTGFPFGHYHYSDVLGLKLVYVPLLIGPAYIAVGYLAWVLATVIIPAKSWFTPVLAMALMVSWDLTFDPTSSTINHWWIWQHGGGYFGVPISNFAGWMVTTLLIYLVFALYLRVSQDEYRGLSQQGDLQAVVMYATIAIGAVIAVFVTKDSIVIDAAGTSWHTMQITVAEAIVSLLTMGVGAALAMRQIRKTSVQPSQAAEAISEPETVSV